MSKHTLTDIPPDQIDEVVADFQSEGCTVTKVEQADGKWTVNADCPDQASATGPKAS